MYEVGEEQRPERSPYWLIFKRVAGHISVFTTRLGSGGDALPVFGHREDALMFLHLAALDGDWEIRETGTGALISMLYSLCKDVEKVTLDPLAGRDVTLLEGSLTMERRRFVEYLIGSEEPLVR